MKTNKISSTLLLISSFLILCSPVFAATTTTTSTTTTEDTSTSTSNSNVITIESTEDTVVTDVDEDTTKAENEYFTLVLTKKSQSSFTGEITYELLVTPHLSSSKTQILWTAPTTLEIKPKHSEFVSMEEDATYKVKAGVVPLKEGTYDISVQVISWQHDTNYANSVTDTITINEDLLSTPVSATYKLTVVLKVLLIIVSLVAVVFVTVKLVKKNIWRAKKWLTPPY